MNKAQNSRVRVVNPDNTGTRFLQISLQKRNISQDRYTVPVHMGKMGSKI